MNKNKFYCFSPAVMLATFSVEILLALVALLRLEKTTPVKLGVLILALLAIFQLSEYAICRDFIFDKEVWGRVGFAAITLLPPLGVHLATSLRSRQLGVVGFAAYGSAIAWMAMFISGGVIEGYQCTTNYLIFNMKGMLGGGFFIYYYTWLLAAMGISLRRIVKKPKNSEASKWLLTGFLAFVAPATIIWLLDGPAARGLPSIMCGFAVVLAIILAAKVLPLSHKQLKCDKTRKSKRKPVK